ncbi:MAG: P-loop NTPase [Isosphaeraceae bacterium]
MDRSNRWTVRRRCSWPTKPKPSGTRPRGPTADGGPPASSLLFTSGKGGVGTSNLCPNLAVALAESGQRVALVDADLGLANIDLLCGLACARDLGDSLAEGRPIAEAALVGPAGVRIVAGAHGMRTLGAARAGDRLIAELDTPARGPTSC